MPLIDISWEEAAKLGIVFCRNCPHPPNNHFDRGPCAHCECKKYEPGIFIFGKEYACPQKKRRSRKSGA